MAGSFDGKLIRCCWLICCWLDGYITPVLLNFLRSEGLHCCLLSRCLLLLRIILANNNNNSCQGSPRAHHSLLSSACVQDPKVGPNRFVLDQFSVWCLWVMVLGLSIRQQQQPPPPCAGCDVYNIWVMVMCVSAVGLVVMTGRNLGCQTTVKERVALSLSILCARFWFHIKKVAQLFPSKCIENSGIYDYFIDGPVERR